jgi:hypothetical protein
MYQPNPDHTWNISMRKDEDASYCCRICGLKQDFKPWGEDGKTPAFEICSCCGVDFGYQDCTPEYAKKFRNEWLKKDSKWANPDEKPANWSLEEQMKNIPKEYK